MLWPLVLLCRRFWCWLPVLMLMLVLLLVLFLLVLLLVLLVLRWLLLVLLLLLCSWGLWLLWVLRRLADLDAGIEVAVAKAHIHLERRSIWHRLIIGCMLLRFCLGRIPRRRSLRSRRMARARWAVDRTVASGRRRRCQRIRRG